MPRYWLPILSGILFALAFYPFFLWPLALVALAPLYFFATDEYRTLREVWWGGFLAGLIISVPLYYFTLGQLVGGLGTETFTFFIRFLSIPATLLESALFGLMALSWRTLRTRSVLFNALAAASTYLVLERAIVFLFQGYNPDALAYAALPLPGALTYAALGGIALVSFLVAVWNILLGEAARAWLAQKYRSALLWPIASAALFVAVAYVYGAYLAPAPGSANALPVAIIQAPPFSAQDLMFATGSGGVFADPRLGVYVAQAAEAGGLVIYPFSPVEGVTSPAQNVAEGRWLNATIPTTTAVLLWNTVGAAGNLYDEFDVWQGTAESVYQKHTLYAFSDYTPAWARALGLAKSPLDVSPSTSTAPFYIDNIAAGGLACSELHQDWYARAQSARASVLIAIGYDAFFPGELMGKYSLAIARYRAAENNIPVIRANMYGPSAFINAGGSVQALLPYGQRGILRGFVVQTPRRTTLYARLGSMPLYAGMLLILCAGAYIVFRRRN